MSIAINLGDLPLLMSEDAATPPLPPVTDAQVYESCQRNPLLSVERSAKGNLEFMPPCGSVDG